MHYADNTRSVNFREEYCLYVYTHILIYINNVESSESILYKKKKKPKKILFYLYLPIHWLSVLIFNI